MCIIIDANKMSSILRREVSAEFEPVKKWLERGHGQVVYGGALLRELYQSEGVKRWLLAQYQAGRAIRVNDDALEREIQHARDNLSLKSDDPHVIGVARASGARILYTGDKNLIQDFKSQEIINNPPGRIYKHEGAQGILTQDACRGCRG